MKPIYFGFSHRSCISVSSIQGPSQAVGKLKLRKLRLLKSCSVGVRSQHKVIHWYRKLKLIFNPMASCPHLRTIETSHGFGHEFENQRASSIHITLHICSSLFSVGHITLHIAHLSSVQHRDNIANSCLVECKSRVNNGFLGNKILIHKNPITMKVPYI